ncbi:unnamed protein product [Urochloa humidicola]
MAPNSSSSKLARSLSIIILLVAVALALAPIAHQSDFDISHLKSTTGPSGGGGGRDPNSPPCIPCPHTGACPWCKNGNG